MYLIKEKFKLGTKIDTSTNEIRKLDMMNESYPLNEEELKEDLVHEIQPYIPKKSRSKWLKECDTNSKYFHGLINMMRRHNSIHGLIIDD
ncbi:hypothetical protein Lal_00031631 [Lupinus albus]|nr:hypothetical protein Lal_00031631 [Lupinus albus]